MYKRLSFEKQLFLFIAIFAAIALLAMWLVIRPSYESGQISERIAIVQQLQSTALERFDTYVEHTIGNVQYTEWGLLERRGELSPLMRNLITLNPDIVNIRITSKQLPDEFAAENVLFPPLHIHIAENLWLSGTADTAMQFAWVMQQQSPKLLLAVRKKLHLDGNDLSITALFAVDRQLRNSAKLPLGLDATAVLYSRGGIIYATDSAFTPSGLTDSLTHVARVTTVEQRGTKWLVLTLQSQYMSVWFTVAVPEASIVDPVRKQFFYVSNLIIGVLLAMLVIGRLVARHLAAPIAELVSDIEPMKNLEFSKKISIPEAPELRSMGEAVESVRIVMEHYQRINVEKIIYEEMKSRFLMKHVEDMIAMTDSDGHFLFVNQRCTDLLKELPIPPQSKKALYEHPSIRTTKETSREEQSGQFQVAFYSAEIKLTRPHGEPEYFALQDIGLRTGDHDFGSMLLLHDLTEDRKLDKIKMDMINVIVHELRNPLSSVIGFISLILEFSDFTIEEIREHLKMAYEASTELNQLIDRFLNVQRLESGRVQFRKEHVDTVGMVQQLINAQKPKLLQKSIEIMYIPQPDMPTVYGAPELLHDAFLNLISNAIKYGDENRTIDIVLRAEPDMMYFVITDHGYGIAPEEQANLFKKFYRVQSNIKAYQQVGTGLGLAHVKEVASYHSGTIALESTPEIGCRFTLSIPLVEPPNSEEEKNAHF